MTQILSKNFLIIWTCSWTIPRVTLDILSSRGTTNGTFFSICILLCKQHAILWACVYLFVIKPKITKYFICFIVIAWKIITLKKCLLHNIVNELLLHPLRHFMWINLMIKANFVNLVQPGHNSFSAFSKMF